jgi:Uma2 family endonuclease
MGAPVAKLRARRERPEQLLFNGDCMDQKTFHALYEQSPPGFRAELIGGVVYLPSPASFRHGRPHTRLILWLGLYMDATPHVDVLDNTSNILSEDDEPQPDAMLRIDPEAGGQTRDVGEYVHGPAELVAEVAYSSRSIDLNAKRRQYELAGINEYLVLDEASKRSIWFTRGRNGFKELEPDVDGLLKSPLFPGLWLNPAAPFERSTVRLLTALRQGLATPEHAAFVAKLEAKAARRRSKKSSRPEAE